MTATAAPLRMVAVTIGSVTLSVLPSMLIGAQAVLIRRDLGLSEAQLGSVVSAFYGAWALSAVRGGRLADRLGADRAMALAALASAAALFEIALVASSWLTLAAGMALAGIGNALAQPATNLGLAREVPEGRLGLAFGIKQTNGPVATMLAGLALPAVGLTLGWRWAFAILGVVGLVFAAVVGARRTAPGPSGSARSRGERLPLARLVIMAVAAIAGTATSVALVTFYVESLVASGIAPGLAGLWFATGSVAGTLARVAWGWIADRRAGDALTQVVLLLLVGAAGFALLPHARGGVALAGATIVVFAAGWGWFGLFLLSVVQSNPGSPAAASGVVNVGVATGGIVGPPAFGALVEHSGYPVAWTCAAAALLLTAALFTVARRVPAG